MQRGQLRHRFQLQEKQVSGQDSFGGDVYQWVTIEEFSGSILQLVGRELAAQQQRHAEARLKLTRSYPHSIEVKREHTILWGSRRLNIQDAEDADGRRRQMVMFLSEYTE